MGLFLCLGFITHFRDGSSERGKESVLHFTLRQKGVIASSQIKLCSARQFPSIKAGGKYCVLS